MFHVELRQFPHATNAFNLSQEELEVRVLRPWAVGKPFELNDRRWSPEKAKLAIYEAPALKPEDMGMGRGWGNVTRSGENVTERMLREAEPTGPEPEALEALKEALAVRVAGRAVSYYELIGMVAEAVPGASDEERLALAASAVWELFREDRLTLSSGR